MTSALLSLDDVVFSYQRGGPGFGPFTFRARAGQIWAVLGPNGAGKSTLFRLIANEITPAGGSLHHDGSVELIPQGLAIPGRLSVRQAFDYLALLRGVPAKRRAAAVEAALAAVDLSAEANTALRRLSGGQQRRAAVGQALVAAPSILLMDEPSAGLDLDQRAKLRDTVAGLGSERLVMVSSHIVEDLAGVADHILHIVDGSVVFAGECEDYVAILGEEARGAGTVEAWTAAYRRWNATTEGTLT